MSLRLSKSGKCEWLLSHFSHICAEGCREEDQRAQEHASRSTFKEFLFSRLSKHVFLSPRYTDTLAAKRLRSSRISIVGQLCFHLTTNKGVVRNAG